MSIRIQKTNGILIEWGCKFITGNQQYHLEDLQGGSLYYHK